MRRAAMKVNNLALRGDGDWFRKPVGLTIHNPQEPLQRVNCFNRGFVSLAVELQHTRQRTQVFNLIGNVLND